MSRQPISSAADTARSASSSDKSATPRPRTGIVFSSLRAIEGIAGLGGPVIISPACEIEGAWIRTKPGAVVKRGDRRHFSGAEFEVEHVEVARNPCRVHRLGDDDITELNMPPNQHLGRCPP